MRRELLTSRRQGRQGGWAYHQYGADARRPDRRNKVFFFGSYESTRDKQNATRTISVPTDALRRGDSVRVGEPDLRPGDRRRKRHRADGVLGQRHSAGPHRSDRDEDHRPDAPAESSGGDQQLLRGGPVRVRPLDARHQGQLECHAEAEHVRTLQPARLLDVQRSGVRRHPAGRPDRRRQPGNGAGQHVQLLGGRHLRVLADPGRRRALRLRPHVHRRRAYRHRPEQRDGPVRHSRTERAPRLRGRHARLPVQHLPVARDHRALHAVHEQRRPVPDGRERQLDEGQTQRPGRHGHLLPGAESSPARDHRRQLWRARRLPLRRRPDAIERRASGNLYNAWGSFLLGLPTSSAA